MRFKVAGFAIAAALCLAAGTAQAQTAAPNVSGNYRCEPQPDACKSGQTFTLAQSGNSIDLRSERGEQGHANLPAPAPSAPALPSICSA
jgi:hypothetical protein